MAINVNEFGADIGVEGQVFPFVANSIETGFIQADKDAVGGFGLWTKAGEPGKVYPTKPENGIFVGLAQYTSVSDTYEAGDIVNVMKKGRMIVKTAAQATAGSPVYITSAGVITSASSGNDAISGAVFKSNAQANGLVEVEIA